MIVTAIASPPASALSVRPPLSASSHPIIFFAENVEEETQPEVSAAALAAKLPWMVEMLSPSSLKAAKRNARAHNKAQEEAASFSPRPAFLPQMPPERFSCQCAREFDEESSLPIQSKFERLKTGGIPRGI
jgi:hypothetical protein